MLLKVVVCLCLLGFVWGQEDVEEVCVCVDPADCVDGFVKDGLPASSMDRRIGPCDGIKSCCSLPGSDAQPQAGSDVQPQPSPGLSFQSVGSHQSVQTTSEVKVQLPTKAQLQGCGVRRFNGSQPKLNNNMIRITTEDDKLAETFYGEVPWLVRILVNGDFACGGSLISNQVVLTAAHCLNGKSSNSLTLVAGDWNAQADVEAEPPQKRSVARVVTHEKFKMVNGENDVALVFADRPFDLTAAVDTVCYPDTHRVVNQNECFAAGWGKVQENEPGYSPILRKIHMPILDRTRCQNKFRKTSLGEQFVLLPGFLCAGGTDDRDTCKGDGGGPLFCATQDEPNRFAVIGVISWGIDCGKGNPTVCASVPFYYLWITKHIQDFSSDYKKSE